MTEQAKTIVSAFVIIACLTLLGVLAYLRIEGASVAAIAVVTTVVAWLTRGPGSGDPPTVVKLVPLFAAGAIIADLLSGCDRAPPMLNVENVAAVAQYEALLTDCRNLGKERNSYDVYEACADAVDRNLCETARLRCKDGGS